MPTLEELDHRNAVIDEIYGMPDDLYQVSPPKPAKRVWPRMLRSPFVKSIVTMLLISGGAAALYLLCWLNLRYIPPMFEGTNIFYQHGKPMDPFTAAVLCLELEFMFVIVPLILVGIPFYAVYKMVSHRI